MRTSVKFISIALVAALYVALLVSAIVLIIKGFIALGIASILGALLAIIMTYYAWHITRRSESLNARVVIIPQANTSMILVDADIVNIANEQSIKLFVEKDKVDVAPNSISFRK